MSHIIKAKYTINMNRLDLLKDCVINKGGQWFDINTNANVVGIRLPKLIGLVYLLPNGDIACQEVCHTAENIPKWNEFLNYFTVEGILAEARVKGYIDIQQRETKNNTILVLQKYSTTKQIVITISKTTGKIKAETKGYGGEDCKGVAEDILQGILQEETIQEELTADYLNPDQVTLQIERDT